MSKPWLDKLPPDLAKIIVDEARKLQPWSRQTAVDEVAQLRQVWLSAAAKSSICRRPIRPNWRSG